jgi:hypothetical protein
MTLKQEARVPSNGIDGQTKTKLDNIGRWNNITKKRPPKLSIRETKMAGGKFFKNKNPIIARPTTANYCATLKRPS